MIGLLKTMGNLVINALSMFSGLEYQFKCGNSSLGGVLW